MDRSLFVFIAIGIGFLYLVTNFMGELDTEDNIQSSFQNKENYNQYISYDSLDQIILDMNNATFQKQKDIWNHSELKDEFLSLYPNFKEMHKFIDERVIGDTFAQKLHSFIKDIEYKLISSKIDSIQAKKELRSF